MKRLLCIIDSLNVGGAETFLMKVMRCLSPNEYQFDFIVSKTGGYYENEILERGGRIYTVPPRRINLFGALKEIYRVVKENQYNYVLRLGDDPMVGIDLISAKLGGADILAFRSCNALVNISLKNRVLNAFMRPILNAITDVKLAPSKLAAEFTFGKTNAKYVHVLQNGVDLNKFCYDLIGRDIIRRELSLENKFVIGHIGRFNKQKNHRYLLEVFYEISKLRDDVSLLLVGTGEEKDKICSWISELGLDNNVVMVGQRFDIPQILSAMDVFVFPSLHEGMPNTVIEAQATGLPCVIADTITQEANITGLVKYLPLTDCKTEWVKSSLLADGVSRKNVVDDFCKNGYDIEVVANEFLSLLRMSDDSN